MRLLSVVLYQPASCQLPENIEKRILTFFPALTRIRLRSFQILWKSAENSAKTFQPIFLSQTLASVEFTPLAHSRVFVLYSITFLPQN